VADDAAGAVRRTPRPTPHPRPADDHQTPETGAPVAPGATNPATPVSPDAGTATGDLSASTPGAFCVDGCPCGATGEAAAACALDTATDVEAYAALPECTACEGTGKDDHATVFEAPLAVHFAGPPIKAEGRCRQLCMWCGHVLIDVELTRDTKPPEWPVSALIKVEDGVATVVPHEPGAELPPGCCALPDDQPQAFFEAAAEATGTTVDDVVETLGEMVAEDRAAGFLPAEDVRALRFHLASVHKVANAFDLLAVDLNDVHQHDHFGPCGPRNHDVADRSYDEAEARAVVAEADDGPNQAQETRAAADWPPEPVDTHSDEQEADRG